MNNMATGGRIVMHTNSAPAVKWFYPSGGLGLTKQGSPLSVVGQVGSCEVQILAQSPKEVKDG